MNNIHFANLMKLASYLRTLPRDYEHFDMSHYLATYKPEYDDLKQFSPGDYAENDPTNCGTVACAVGHGPKAGVPFEEYDDSWDRYADRAFGCTIADDDVGDFMFGPEWAHGHQPGEGTNTPQEAARRIEAVVACHGTVPLNVDQYHVPA